MTLLYKGFFIEPRTPEGFKLTGVKTPRLNTHQEARQYIRYLLIYDPAFNGGYGLKSAKNKNK
jgi:hypothetical protein